MFETIVKCGYRLLTYLLAGLFTESPLTEITSALTLEFTGNAVRRLKLGNNSPCALSTTIVGD